jgi:hypothetical protein
MLEIAKEVAILAAEPSLGIMTHTFNRRYVI